MSVTSCSASQTSCRNVLGGFGGMTFEPKVSLLCSKSAFDPLRPGNDKELHLIPWPQPNGMRHPTTSWPAPKQHEDGRGTQEYSLYTLFWKQAHYMNVMCMTQNTHKINPWRTHARARTRAHTHTHTHTHISDRLCDTGVTFYFIL